MVAMQKSVRVPSESELGQALRDAATTGQSLVVETDEATYKLDIASSSPPGQEADSTLRKPTPEEIANSIEGIDRATGGWVGLVGAEALKAYIRERRRTSSRPPVEL